MNKITACSQHVPSATQRHHWFIGILGYLFDSLVVRALAAGAKGPGFHS